MKSSIVRLSLIATIAVAALSGCKKPGDPGNGGATSPAAGTTSPSTSPAPNDASVSTAGGGSSGTAAPVTSGVTSGATVGAASAGNAGSGAETDPVRRENAASAALGGAEARRGNAASDVGSAPRP